MIDKWKVWGECGPGYVERISKEIFAPTAAEALDQFYDFMEDNYPDEWETMGKHNVYISKLD